MAAMYAESDRGYLLNSFAHLWSGIGPFWQQAARPLDAIAWPDERRLRIATALRTALPRELPELFQISLWDELRNGFQRVWRMAIAPRSQAYVERFAYEMEAIVREMPGLDDVRFVLCHPLRRHGRLLSNVRGEPTIAVGVADPHFDVASLHPVMQACHEYFVRESLPSRGTAANYATVPGRNGYEVFSSIEGKALRKGARLFIGSPWQQAYTQWLAIVCPGRSPEELLREE